MLRYGFLPSDFNPQFLVLGDRADVAALARTLRDFAKAPAEIDIEPGRKGPARLTLLPSAASRGLRKGDGPGRFCLELDSAGAAAFADMIDEMLAALEPAGSTILECAGGSDIPVKVSFGEFTEDFLVDAF